MHNISALFKQSADMYNNIELVADFMLPEKLRQYLRAGREALFFI
jgi:hypothetical protein